MVFKINIYLFSIFFLVYLKLNAQIVYCGLTPLSTANCSVGAIGSNISISPGSGTNQNLTFDFDSFSKINGGITQYGASIIKIKTVNNPASTCNWTLKMYVSSTPPLTTWDALTNYGAGSGLLPPLTLIQVRVTNGCSTPQNAGVWQTFSAAAGTPIPIIDNATLLAAGALGACSGGVLGNPAETNGAGSYLTNYTSFTFNVDYKIILGGFTYRPGLYTLKIEYCLSER